MALAAAPGYKALRGVVEGDVKYIKAVFQSKHGMQAYTHAALSFQVFPGAGASTCRPFLSACLDLNYTAS